MSTPTPHPAHIWYTPAECAELLGGTRHGDKWKATCPAHDDRDPSLGIAQGRDKHGHPMTLLHCFAGCTIEAICAAMGIALRNLFCMAPEYHEAMRHFPPAKSPRIARLKRLEEPTPDEIAQLLLEEMIVSDPAFLQECAPARARMWELAQASPRAKVALTHALEQAHVNVFPFWQQLAAEYGGTA